MTIRKGFKVQRAQLADRVPTPFLVYSNGSDHNSVQTLLLTTVQLLAIAEGLELLRIKHDTGACGCGACAVVVRELCVDLGRLLQAI